MKINNDTNSSMNRSNTCVLMITVICQCSRIMVGILEEVLWKIQTLLKFNKFIFIYYEIVKKLGLELSKYFYSYFLLNKLLQFI